MYINDLNCFSSLRTIRDSENISHCDLEVYIDHIDKLSEDFKIRVVE